MLSNEDVSKLFGDVAARFGEHCPKLRPEQAKVFREALDQPAFAAIEDQMLIAEALGNEEGVKEGLRSWEKLLMETLTKVTNPLDD
jgi:hypothetical protein